MEQSYVGFRILLVVLILAVNGFFAAAEVSLIAVRRSRLHQMVEEGHSGAQAALNLLANPERLLSVTQVGVTVASLGLGWAGEDTVFRLLFSATRWAAIPLAASILRIACLAVSFLLISYCHVVIGEVVPKNLAIEKADRLAALVAPVLLLFYRVCAPFVIAIERTSAALSRVLRLGAGHRGGGHSAEELKLIVTSSRGLGYLPAAQEDMIHRVLDLEHLSVREIMVPRNDIVSIPVDATLEQVLHTMIEHQHSRLPVYDGKPEQFVGIVHYKDLLPVWEERRVATRADRTPRPFRVRVLMRKLLVVPETKPLLQMLEEFRSGKSHMALVVDEFGTIVGLLTVEDVLEQIVGNIEDEYDVKAERPLLEAAELELDGATKIRDLETDYGIEIPGDAGFETLAGFLLYKLGDIPKPGDQVPYQNRRYVVLEMERNRIAKVRIEKIEPAQPAAQTG